jgi:KaiC/GvpD/RAD55 family RecA-like ATPase
MPFGKNENQFLGNFKDLLLVTFDDREFVPEKDKSLITYGKPENYKFGELARLNARGAGIFFSVNQFPGGRRTKEACAGVNAWYVENDKATIEDQMKMYFECALPPSFMVRSKKSIHAYWLPSGVASKENFEKIQRGLIQRFDGDPAMKDIARVLRVPGFNHNKSETPFPVELIWFEPETKYSEKQMMGEFPYTEPVLKPVMPTLALRPASSGTDLWKAMSELNNKEVLIRLSGSSIVNGEAYTFSKRTTGGEYISVNGKPANCWIDANGFIGSGSKAGPSWIQWFLYYGHTKADVAKWAKENLRDMLPAAALDDNNYDIPVANSGITWSKEEAPKKEQKIKVTTAADHIESVTASLNTPPSPITWGTDNLDFHLPTIEPGHYVVLWGQQSSGKTTFAFNMARENEKRIGKVVFVSLEMGTDQLLRKWAREMGNVGKQQYRERRFDKDIAKTYLPELGTLGLVGIDDGDQYTTESFRKIIVEHGAKMLFIDNMNKIKGKGKSEFEVTQSVSQELLTLTRQYNIPIVLIHHANKQPAEKSTKKKVDPTDDGVKFRGMGGMRGTNKTADDADIIVEVTRPFLSLPTDNPFQDDKDRMNKAKTCIAAYKDREFDSRVMRDVYYFEGSFYDDWELIKGKVADALSKRNEINEIAESFGGEVIN